MKSYLENRIEIFKKGQAKEKEYGSHAMNSYARNFHYTRACKYAFAISEANKALNYFISQNETRNIGNNESQKKVCVTCGKRMRVTYTCDNYECEKAWEKNP
jgi:hypothetical protein